MIDNRIDSIESGLPNQVMDVIKDEFKNTTKPNWELLSDDEKNKEIMWIEKEYYSKKSYNDAMMSMEEPVPMVEMVEEDRPRRARIIPMQPHGVGHDDGPMQAG